MASRNGVVSIKIPKLIESIGCQELLTEETCSHSGWLRKRPSIKKLSLFFNWHQAYVVLNDGCLYYFKSEKAKSSSGKFCLYGYNSVFRASDIQAKESPWAFKIVHSHREFKTYYFSASSEREMKIWMSKIKQELLKANGKNLTKCYVYGKVIEDEKIEENDTKFYQEVEMNIYDDSAKFLLPSNYSKQFGVKKGDEDSDDEDLNSSNPSSNIEARPPALLPGQRDITTRAPIALPRNVVNIPKSPKTPIKLPRLPDPPITDLPIAPTSRAKHTTNGHAKNAKNNEVNNLASILDVKLKTRSESRSPSQSPNPRRRRRGSYIDTEGEEGAAIISPINSPSYEHKNLPRISSGKHGASTSASDAAKQASISAMDLDDLENMDGEVYWSSIYYRDGDKQKAQEILQSIAVDGVYLVRPEEKDKTKNVLVVYANEQTRKYRIEQSEEGEYFIQRNGGYRNSSLEEMLAHYYDDPLPTVHVYLTVPYKLHKKYWEHYT